MKYKTRKGIVHIPVGGEHLLVSTRELWPEVKMFRHIPKSTALCWDMLSRGADDQKVAAIMLVLTHRPLKEIQEGISQLWEKLYQAGYLEKIEEQV